MYGSGILLSVVPATVHGMIPLSPRFVVTLSVVSFLALTALALAFSDRPLVREGYLAFLLVGIVVVGLVGIEVVPFVHFLKFSEPDPQGVVSHELRVADDRGNELPYDARASPPLVYVQTRYLAANLPDEDYDTQVEVSAYMLRNACTYRASVEAGDRSLLDRLRFPRHTIDYRWTRATLAEVSAFEAIRVYRLEIESSNDGTEIVSRHEERVLSVHVDEMDEEVRAACS